MTSNLATQLREGTSKSHTMAENVNFIKSFLGGVIDKSSYVEMLSKLYFVYEAIEKAMEENKEHEYIKPIYFPELNRTQSLKEDLDFHYGERWLESTKISPATLDYVNRINQISKEKPELLVAHAYTRYLGDLSGGQMLAPKVPGSGKMYKFEAMGHSVEEMKELIRRRVSEDDHIEANIAFGYRTKMYEQLNDL